MFNRKINFHQNKVIMKDNKDKEMTTLAWLLIVALQEEKIRVNKLDTNVVTNDSYVCLINETIRELEYIYKDKVKESPLYKRHLRKIEDNETMQRIFDEYRKKLNSIVRLLVNPKFVDEFNDAFCFKSDSDGLPYDFEPATLTKKGTMKRDVLISIINDMLIHDIMCHGVNVGIEKINDQWVEVKDDDKMFVVKDKFYGIFLFDYKMDRLFPESEGWKHAYKFTRLRIKLNSPKSEWKSII
jgi:hypothetical protein